MMFPLTVMNPAVLAATSSSFGVGIEIVIIRGAD